MSSVNRELCKVARRVSRDPAEAEDLVQQAWLAALERGPQLESEPQWRAWLTGAIRKLGALEARTAARRRRRETAWAATDRSRQAPGAPCFPARFIASLPRAVRGVAQLVVADLAAHEIRWILRLPDTAFRQRLVRLRRHWLAWPKAGMLAAPAACQALGPRRPALVALVRERQQVAFLATDPDGHVLLFCRAPLTKAESAATEEGSLSIPR